MNDIWKEGSDPSPVTSKDIRNLAKAIMDSVENDPYIRDMMGADKILELIKSQSGENGTAIARDSVIRRFVSHTEGTVEEQLAKLVYLLWKEKTELVSYLMRMSNDQGLKLNYENGHWKWEVNKPTVQRITVINGSGTLPVYVTQKELDELPIYDPETRRFVERETVDQSLLRAVHDYLEDEYVKDFVGRNLRLAGPDDVMCVYAPPQPYATLQECLDVQEEPQPIIRIAE